MDGVWRAVRALGRDVGPYFAPGLEKRFWTRVPASDPPALEPAWGEPARNQPSAWGPPSRGVRDSLFLFGDGVIRD